MCWGWRKEGWFLLPDLGFHRVPGIDSSALHSSTLALELGSLSSAKHTAEGAGGASKKMLEEYLTTRLCFVFVEWEVFFFFPPPEPRGWMCNCGVCGWQVAEHRLRWHPHSLGGGVQMEVWVYTWAEHWKSHHLLSFLPPLRTWLNSNSQAMLFG